MKLEFKREYTDEEVNDLGIFLRLNGINGYPAYMDDAETEGYILKRNRSGKLEIEACWTYMKEGRR